MTKHTSHRVVVVAASATVLLFNGPCFGVPRKRKRLAMYICMYVCTYVFGDAWCAIYEAQMQGLGKENIIQLVDEDHRVVSIL